MIGIVVSRADGASELIGEHLLALDAWDEITDDARSPEAGGGTVYRTGGFELRTFAQRHLDTVGAASAFDDPDAVVFVSRHAGETGPLLTAHFTGNLGPADHGGEAGELAVACPNAAKRALAALDRRAPDGYDVSLECTHHGPSEVGAPAMFVELGSGPDQWDDDDAAAAVARAVLDLRGVAPTDRRTVVAFGGGHYAPRPTRIARETDWAVGHVAADWGLEAMGDPAANRDVVAQVFERSGATHAAVQGDRPALRSVVSDLGYRVVGETWLRETDDVPLDLVDALEEDLCEVAAGLRFGDGTDVDGYDVVSLPEDLLAAAAEVDREATRAAADATLVAYETAEGGTLVAGRGAVTDRAARDALVDRLVAVLESGYDTVDRTDGAVVVTEEAFDPDAARALGVPEGPAFGRLADGDPVEVDGETIRPADVHRERTRRFPV